MTADDDGVLGSANDREFGGQRRFARTAEGKDGDKTNGAKKGGEEKGVSAATGLEAGSMEEGLLPR